MTRAVEIITAAAVALAVLMTFTAVPTALIKARADVAHYGERF